MPADFAKICFTSGRLSQKRGGGRGKEWARGHWESVVTHPVPTISEMSLWDGGTHGMDFRDQSRNAGLSGTIVTSPHLTHRKVQSVFSEPILLEHNMQMDENAAVLCKGRSRRANQRGEGTYEILGSFPLNGYS